MPGRPATKREVNFRHLPAGSCREPPTLDNRQNWYMDLEAVASELYGLAQGDFTSVRDVRASEAKRVGDRELARAIGKLRRPTASAWIANVLVRERGDQVQSMLALGAAIRQAQAQLAKDDLRQLQRERRRAIAALLDEAAGLARDRGESLSSAVTRDLEATLEAALLDPEAATALRAGMLTTGLRYAGLGWSEATDDLSPSADTSEQEETVAAAGKSRPGLPATDQALRQAAAEAQREAEAQLAQAQLKVDEHRRDAAKAALDCDVWRRKVADLDKQLKSAQEEAQRAEHRSSDAEQSLALAERRLRTAEAGLVDLHRRDIPIDDRGTAES